MLQKVELFVAGGGPEVIPQDLLALSHLVAILIDNRDAGLLAEWWIGQNEVDAIRPYSTLLFTVAEVDLVFN